MERDDDGFDENAEVIKVRALDDFQESSDCRICSTHLNTEVLYNAPSAAADTSDANIQAQDRSIRPNNVSPDRIVPTAHGGWYALDNIQLVCSACNSTKSWYPDAAARLVISDLFAARDFTKVEGGLIVLRTKVKPVEPTGLTVVKLGQWARAQLTRTEQLCTASVLGTDEGVVGESSGGSSKAGGGESNRGDEPTAKKQHRKQGEVYDGKVYGRVKDKERSLTTDVPLPLVTHQPR